MATSFIETEDLEFSKQLIHFAKRLPTYSSILGVTTTEKNSALADALFFEFVLSWMGGYRDFAYQTTAYKELARYGNDAEVMGDVPATPEADTPPTLVDADIQKRFSDLVARIKKSPNYSEAIGKDLGVVASETPFVPGDGKPNLTVKLVESGFPQIKFTIGQYEGIQLLKDSGLGFSLLNVVLHPTYVDKSGMPAPGTSIIVKYKGIYLYKGVSTGEYSDVVSITVTG